MKNSTRTVWKAISELDRDEGVRADTSALLIASPEFARKQGLRPRARIVANAVCGDDPELMLTATIPATRKVLARHAQGACARRTADDRTPE